jgi:uncharacterized protein (DUF433 family)
MSEKEFWAGCPDSEQDPQKLGGRPTVGPYRVAAQTPVECEDLGGTPEEIADDYGLPVAKVQAILSYYHARQLEPMPSR